VSEDLKAKVQPLNVELRRKEKALSRRSDAASLANGSKSREELKRENGHFSGLNVRVDYKRSKLY